MPVCITCGLDKDQSLFAKRGNKYRGNCRICHNASKKAWSKANPEKKAESVHLHYAKKVGKHPDECRLIRRTAEEIRALRLAGKKDYYLRNKEKCVAWARQSVLRRREEVAAYQLEWRAANKERKAANDKLWRQKNAGRVNWYSGNRKRAEKRAAPPWLTGDQWAEIQSFYERAANLTILNGVQYEVDHIEPIQGKHSCGLHVPWNLQVITRSENRSKSNRIVSEAA